MKHVQTSISIAASPDEVWQVLTAFSQYDRWNPFVRSIVGQAKKGERLSVEVAQSGSKVMRFRPLVLVADPSRELRWIGRFVMPGLFDGEHYFTLKTEHQGTRLIHGEKFTGIIPMLLGDGFLAQMQLNFNAMNTALKQEVEAANAKASMT